MRLVDFKTFWNEHHAHPDCRPSTLPPPLPGHLQSSRESFCAGFFLVFLGLPSLITFSLHSLPLPFHPATGITLKKIELIYNITLVSGVQDANVVVS